MSKQFIIKLAATGLFLLLALPGFSQLSNTLYFMKGVPQVYQVNPAFQPGCKFFIGLPGLSPLQLRVQEKPLTMSDVIYYNSTAGQLITFLNPLGNPQAFLDALGDKNFINADIGIPLASIGFGSPSKGQFVGFDITQRVSVNFNYPRDLMKVPILGLDSAMNFDFNGFGLNALVYTELAMNISQKLGDMVTVGWRGKILLGQANLSTSKFDVTLATGETAWPVHSNIVMNATLPFLDIQYDQDGMIDFNKMDVIPDINKNIPNLIFNPKNIGLAMDLGVDIRPMEWLQVSASVVDFGSIKWKDKVNNLENKADYQFNGVEFKLGGSDPIQPLIDSLSESFKFSATQEAYRTWLPTKVFLGASFYVHPKISFGVLSRTEFYQKNLRQQFTFSANLYPIRMISTTFSYSLIEGNYKNIGLGLSLKVLPFNFYIITDTGPSLYFWPTEGNYVNLRLGMNLSFGCKQKKSAKYDMPLVN
ncbi:MAG: hypothetical protein H6539_08550 [Bacteroidales bacterium]|nr:hypothetical protein [Bacteroidales bacterium]